MKLYLTALVWLLRLVAIGQIGLAMLMFMPSSDAISGPIGVAQREPIEQALAITIGPLVCLAVAEVLALLLKRHP